MTGLTIWHVSYEDHHILHAASTADEAAEYMLKKIIPDATRGLITVVDRQYVQSYTIVRSKPRLEKKRILV
jgi:hypothetical protein